MQTTPPPTIAGAVAALKEFAARLASHPAIQTEEWEIGGPAPAEVIAHYRANPQLLPRDLVDLYELMNGCELRWRYEAEETEDEDEDTYLGGDFCVRPLTIDPEQRGMRFGTDWENDTTFFGPTTISMLFDEMQPEYGTWLVAYGPGGSRTPIPKNYEPYRGIDQATQRAAHAQADLNEYVPALLYSKTDVQQLPGTIADYLLAGIAHGFIGRWPLAWQNSPSGDEEQEQVARYQALMQQ